MEYIYSTYGSISYRIVKLEETLRMMQRRLSQIAQIPLIIQSTLDAVARSFDDFLPPEMTMPEVPLTLIDLSAFVEASQAKAEEALQELERQNNEFDNNDETDDDEKEELYEEMPVDEPLPEPEPEPEIVEVIPEPTEEEIQRMEKIDRVIIYTAIFFYSKLFCDNIVIIIFR